MQYIKGNGLGIVGIWQWQEGHSAITAPMLRNNCLPYICMHSWSPRTDLAIAAHFLPFIMHSPPGIVGKGIVFLGCPSITIGRLFLHSSRQILLPWYLMNGLSNLDETCSEYLWAATDDL